ncbi:MAG: PKD domain-containing protein [Actinomycetota bacterium]|nr:PKD domain-containing protein [Actinomycetota bacterium]
MRARVVIVVLLAVAAGVFGMSAGAQASITCPPGTTNPAYCTSTPDFCVYVDSPVLRLTSGHVFVQMLPDRGRQKGSKNLVYGLSPVSAWHPFGGAGEFPNTNATHGWDYKICYPVSVRRYNNMANFINRSLARPPNYDLLDSNCVIWSENVAGVGGIRLPSSINRAGIPDPAALEDNLISIGAGKKFRGGTVRKNPGRVAPNGGADPVSRMLDANSYTGLEEFALRAPGRLAAGLHLRNHELHLPTRSLGLNQRATVALTGVKPSKAIIAMSWGDGSVSLQRPSASHRYGRPGRYRITIVVVKNSTLFRVTGSILVMRVAPPQAFSFVVPHDGRQSNFPRPPGAPVADDLPTS